MNNQEEAKERIEPPKQGKLDEGDEVEPEHTKATPLRPITE